MLSPFRNVITSYYLLISHETEVFLRPRKYDRRKHKNQNRRTRKSVCQKTKNSLLSKNGKIKYCHVETVPYVRFGRRVWICAKTQVSCKIHRKVREVGDFSICQSCDNGLIIQILGISSTWFSILPRWQIPFFCQSNDFHPSIWHSIIYKYGSQSSWKDSDVPISLK